MHGDVGSQAHTFAMPLGGHCSTVRWILLFPRRTAALGSPGDPDFFERCDSVSHDLKNAFERAREACKDRKIRDESPRRVRTAAEREKFGALVEVRHPDIGAIRVKARSNFDAQCAAEEALGLPFLALRGCTVNAI